MTAEVVRALYWFNPLVWIACARLRQDSEQACDDVVLAAGVSGTDYASHLVEIARTLKGQPRALLPASAMARPSSLKGRIDAMLNASLDRKPLTRLTRLFTTVALLIFTMSIAGFGAQTFFTVSGTVLDATNRILPATRLVLTNVASEAKYEIKSDRSGHFDFVGLPPGDYALEASLPGFRTFKDRLAIVARNIDRTIQLSVGSLEETLTIVGSRATADAEPTPDQLEARQAARRKAEERQRAALEKCSGTGGTMGGQILAPLRLTNVNPRYPDALRSAGIGGVVTLDALIGIDGNVQEARAVNSPHPDLEAAGIEAVRQWQFTPTLLNCVPVEVPMRVTLNFKAQP
jgi:TonB family protein